MYIQTHIQIINKQINKQTNKQINRQTKKIINKNNKQINIIKVLPAQVTLSFCNLYPLLHVQVNVLGFACVQAYENGGPVHGFVLHRFRAVNNEQ